MTRTPLIQKDDRPPHCRPRVTLFEDDCCRLFGPASDLRPAWRLRTGALTGIERFGLLLKGLEIKGVGRTHLAELFKEEWLPAGVDHSDVLCINGLAALDAETAAALLSERRPMRWMREGRIAAVLLPEGQALPLDAEGLLAPEGLSSLPSREWPGELLTSPWVVIDRLEAQIESDIALLKASRALQSHIPRNFVFVSDALKVLVGGEVEIGLGVILDAGGNSICLEEGARVESGAIIDAAAGSIWIGEGAVVQAGAIIKGPVYIGPSSIIRPGARLMGPVSLGQQTRVGGELSGVVVQGYSNKQHSGYLGGAYVGEFVNLGAATDNSDLKNNYKPVSVSIRGCRYDTGMIHFGAIIGDFTRTAIHTRLNTGTVVGVCANVFGNGFPPGELPAFTWFGPNGAEAYRLDKALETIKAVMPRRKLELTGALAGLLEKHFNETMPDRQGRGIK